MWVGTAYPDYSGGVHRGSLAKPGGMHAYYRALESEHLKVEDARREGSGRSGDSQTGP